MGKTHNEVYKNGDVALWKLQFHTENNSLRYVSQQLDVSQKQPGCLKKKKKQNKTLFSSNKKSWLTKIYKRKKRGKKKKEWYR